MKQTIEERANQRFPAEALCDYGAHYDGYVLGATEQKRIDDTEKQEWLNKAIDTVRDIANEYFGDWEQSCKVAERFKKAMETMKTNKTFEGCVANVPQEVKQEVDANIALEREFYNEWEQENTTTPEDWRLIRWGMQKQKQIDFGKIDDDYEGCDLCRKVYRKKLIEKAKQAFTKVCGWLEILPGYKEMFDGFVQELEKTK